ncbi:hypothetical protein [Streptomyces sp. DG1A-41]|uniref:GntT/GntP/DsdX family permease n=1 Tax=Streptomyces sp. DG1A-41 TaxID=3125779 RepID=UPI0030CD3C2A
MKERRSPAYGVARASRKPLLVYALPMGAAMLTVQAFLLPHPGAVAVVEAIGASQGLVLLMGIPVTAVVVLLGYLASRRLTRREYPMDPAVYAEVYGETSTDVGTTGPAGAAGGTPAGGAPGDGGQATAVLTKPADTGTGMRPPSFGMVLTLVVTPILLILLGTIGQNTLTEGSALRAVLTVLGAPMEALLTTSPCAVLPGRSSRL